MGGLNRRTSQSVQNQRQNAPDPSNVLLQKRTPLPDRPEWLEQAIETQIKKKICLEFQEKKLDELEHKLRNKDRVYLGICYTIVGSPVVLFVIGWVQKG